MFIILCISEDSVDGQPINYTKNAEGMDTQTVHYVKCIEVPEAGNYEEISKTYCQTSNISGTLVGNKIVDHSDVVGVSPVGTAPTTSSFST